MTGYIIHERDIVLVAVMFIVNNRMIRRDIVIININECEIYIFIFMIKS